VKYGTITHADAEEARTEANRRGGGRTGASATEGERRSPGGSWVPYTARQDSSHRQTPWLVSDQQIVDIIRDINRHSSDKPIAQINRQFNYIVTMVPVT
jgi:hypothetical protein